MPAAPVSGARCGPCEHLVRFYSHEARLPQIVRSYLSDGLVHRDAVVLLATEEHHRLIVEDLRRSGADVDRHVANGALRWLDAQKHLDRVLRDDRMIPELFQEVMAEAIRAAAPNGRSGEVRVFSEIVDLLWRAGRFDAAFSVEERWDALSCAERFRVLCVYRLDIFDAMLRDVPVDVVAKLHRGTHFDCDVRDLQQVVNRAMRDLLGIDRAESIRRMIASVEPPLGMSHGPEFELFWLRDNLRGRGREILECARMEFSANGASGTSPGKPLGGSKDLCTILIVEDDPNDAYLVEYEMRRNASNLRVHLARDAEAAWQYLQFAKAGREGAPLPTHILLDLKLPRVSGFELLERIQGDAELKRIPVTILSSSREPEDVSRAYRGGARAFIVKRVDLADVVRGLATLCSIPP